VEAVLAIVSLLVGFVLAEVKSEREEGRRIKRERKQRQADFQRETLLALQDALFRLSRSEAQVHRAMELTARQGTPWRQIKVPVELDEENRLIRAEAYVLKVRVSDDRVRELTNAVTSEVVMGGLTQSATQAAGALIAAQEAFAALNDRIGELLRGEE
jgi:hypothetical protein